MVLGRGRRDSCDKPLSQIRELFHSWQEKVEMSPNADIRRIADQRSQLQSSKNRIRVRCWTGILGEVLGDSDGDAGGIEMTSPFIRCVTLC